MLLSNLHMFGLDQQTFKYDRYIIVVLTKRAANENLKAMQNENILPSLHCFLLHFIGWNENRVKWNFMDVFSQR